MSKDEVIKFLSEIDEIESITVTATSKVKDGERVTKTESITIHL